MKLCEKNGIVGHNLDLDKIGHEVQDTLQEPIYQQTRQKIIQIFGEDVANPNGSINRKTLGPKVF
jgi:dephospho-CoA kinase